MDRQERMEKRMEKEMINVKPKPQEPLQIRELFKLRRSGLNEVVVEKCLSLYQLFWHNKKVQEIHGRYKLALTSERGDVPGWVLVVLMTTGLVTAIWTIAAPRLTSILKNSLDAMNGIR